MAHYGKKRLETWFLVCRGCQVLHGSNDTAASRAKHIGLGYVVPVHGNDTVASWANIKIVQTRVAVHESNNLRTLGWLVVMWTSDCD